MLNSFKNWLLSEEYLENTNQSPIVFLDLDETLVSTLKMPSNPNNIDELITLGGTPINNSHISFLRTHAIEFVNKMKSIAKTYIITAGGKEFQKKVVKALNIPIEQHDVFGIEDYDLIEPEHNILPKSKNSVLVDDLHHTAPNTMSKLYALNINEDRHIKVNPFNFNPILAKKFPRIYKNDDELLKIQTQILNML